jgi:cytochrome P450
LTQRKETLMPSRLPPGPNNGLLGLHNLRAFQRDLIGFAARLKGEYGDAVTFRCGTVRFFQFTHPDQVREVLVEKAKHFHKHSRVKRMLRPIEGQGLPFNDGPSWLRQRRLLQPAFAPARLTPYAEDVLELTQHLLDGWSGRDELNVAEEFHRLTLQIALRTLFGRDLYEDPAAVHTAVADLQLMSITDARRTVPLPWWMPVRYKRRGRAAVAFLAEMIERRIRERSAADPGRDMLGMMLAAVDHEGQTGRMSDDQLRAEAIVMLLAAHETTANGLTFATYLLAKHQAWQERLTQEVRGLLGERPPTAADLPALAGVERAFEESMRLYPPVYFLRREACEDVEIGGYPIRRGQQVNLVPYLVHRDPRWFAEPETFDPDRFLPEARARRHPMAYSPFGAGPRMCIGKGLAMMEGTLILASLLQRFTLALAPGQGEPGLVQQITLQPRGGVRVVLHGAGGCPMHRGAPCLAT